MSKGQWEPTQVVKVLGLLLNLQQGHVFMPVLKLLQARHCVRCTQEIT